MAKLAIIVAACAAFIALALWFYSHDTRNSDYLDYKPIVEESIPETTAPSSTPTADPTAVSAPVVQNLGETQVRADSVIEEQADDGDMDEPDLGLENDPQMGELRGSAGRKAFAKERKRIGMQGQDSGI